LEGSLPDREEGGPTTVGVFLNDGSGAKLGYYLTHSAALTGEGCRPDGRRVLRLEINLGSTAPPNGLPADVLGLGLAGDPYTVRTNVMVFSPAGGAIMDDFDNDGLLDLVFTTLDPTQTMAYFRNKGDGTFENRTKRRWLCRQSIFRRIGKRFLFAEILSWRQVHLKNQNQKQGLARIQILFRRRGGDCLLQTNTSVLILG